MASNQIRVGRLTFNVGKKPEEETTKQVVAPKEKTEYEYYSVGNMRFKKAKAPVTPATPVAPSPAEIVNSAKKELGDVSFRGISNLEDAALDLQHKQQTFTQARQTALQTMSDAYIASTRNATRGFLTDPSRNVAGAVSEYMDAARDLKDSYSGYQFSARKEQAEEERRMMEAADEQRRPNSFVQDWADSVVGLGEHEWSGTNPTHVLPYLMGETAQGAADQVWNIRGGISTAVGDLLTGGKVSNNAQKIQTFFDENPREYAEFKAVATAYPEARGVVLADLARKAGVSAGDMETFRQDNLARLDRESMQNTLEVSEGVRDVLGNLAFTAGQQIPALALTAGGSGTPLERAVANVLMGTGAAGGKLQENAKKYGADWGNYASAVATGMVEAATEALGNTNTISSILRKPFAEASLGEMLEEFVGYPLGQVTDWLTLKDGARSGQDFSEIFDLNEWFTSSISGLALGSMMGSVSAVANIAGRTMENKMSLPQAAVDANKVAALLPEDLRPQSLDPSKATAPKIRQYLSQVMDANLTLAERMKAQPKKGAEVATEMGIGKNGAEAAQQAGITPENVGAFTANYEAGKNGKAFEEVKTVQTGIDENTARQAFNAGQMDAIAEGNAEQGVIENEERAEEIRLRGSSERFYGQNPGGQTGSVVESTGRDQSGETKGRPGNGGADSLVYDRRTVTTGSLGIAFGSNKDAIRMVVGGENQYTAEAKKMAGERGLRVQFFVGNNMTIRNKSVRGYISGDRVFIRADHPVYTADRIMRHEVGHDMISKGEIDVESVRTRLLEKYDDEQLHRIAELYALALSDSDSTAKQVWEEIICDSLGDMNVFAESGAGGAIGGVLADVKSAAVDDGKASAEPKYSYASLTSKPDMKLTVVDDSVPYEITRDNKNEIRRKIVKDAIKNASRIGKTNETGGVSVYVDDIGADVVLSTHGLRHGLDRRLESSAPVVLQAGEIIKNAVRINENTPKDKNADYGYVLLGAAKNKAGNPYIVRFVVNGYTNAVDTMDVLYAINAKKEPAALLPAITDESATLTDSKISISQILDFASKYFPEILPESVLRHYGFEARPAGELGESMLYSEDVPDEAVQKALAQYIEKYGSIEPGENPFRTVQVPKKTGENENVSKTVRTILEAKATPEAAIPTIEQMVANGDLSFETITDKQAIADAQAKLTTKGWSKTLAKWLGEAKNGTVSKDHTVTGWALYNNAANAGDLDTAMTVLEEMVKSQRNAAQALQATRVLKKMSPEAQLYAAQRSVEDLQEELNERYGEKNVPEIKIDPELAEVFMAAKTDKARDEAMAEIYKDVGRQMPSTFRDKWNAWRYLAMLGNPRTHVRNIVGNAGFAPVVAAKNLTATAIEKAVNAATGGKTGRSKAIIGTSKADKALLSAAWADYDNVQAEIMAGGKYSDFQIARQSIEEGRRIFRNRLLEGARRANSASLEAEDAWFSKPHYAYALAGYCKANNITPEMVKDGKAIQTARSYAIRESQKATYRDTNAFSQMISDLGKVNKSEKNVVKKGLGLVLQGILPFRKTPANILVRGVEYSPIGLIKSIAVDSRKVAKGDLSATDLIDNLSAGLTGTGLLAMGAFLAAQGLIRGHGPEDKEKEFEELQGHQAYSLEIGGTSITLDWLAPECLPFFVGVNLYEQSVAQREDITMSTILSAITNVSEPLLEMSCLQSLNDVFDAVGYASSNDLSALPSALASAATSYLTQAIPTILGQAERTGQDVRYTTYTSKNAFLTRNMQYAIGSATSRIPGLDYNQIPYIDAWGRREETGNVAQRAFGNFLNPSYSSNIEESEMEQELLRVYGETGDASVFPTRAQRSFPVGGETKYLTADEYVKYATQKGQISYDLVSKLVDLGAYERMSEEEKVAAVSDAYALANVIAKQAVSGYTTTGWMQKAVDAKKNVKLDYAKYMEVRLAVKDIESLKDKDGKSIDGSKSLQIMEAIYTIKGLNDKQRLQLFEDFGVGESFWKDTVPLNKAAVEAKLKNMR